MRYSRAGAQPHRVCVPHGQPDGSVLPLKPSIIFRAGGAGRNSKQPWLVGLLGYFFLKKKKSQTSNKSGSSFASVNRWWSQELIWSVPLDRREQDRVPQAVGWRQWCLEPSPESSGGSVGGSGGPGALPPAGGRGGTATARWARCRGAAPPSHRRSWGKRSAARGSLLSNAGALCGMVVIIIALKQSTKSLLLWRDH